MVLKRIYLALSRLYPPHMRQPLQKILVYAGIDEDAELWTGRTITVVLLFSLSAFIAPLTFLRFHPLLDAGFLSLTELLARYSIPFFLLAFALLAFLFYLYLFYRIQARTEAIEKVLPDFLLIVVSNLHAGMSPFAAFMGAARPEFGPLEEEIKKVAARTSASQSITVAFSDLSNRINSSVFQKTIIFFEKAVRSGGQMAKILHASADEIRHIEEMRQELISQTRSYIIFLAFIMIFVAPFLLAISNQFLVMFLKMRSQMGVSVPAAFNIQMFQGEIKISPLFVENISLAFLACASLLISMFMGSIMRGKPLYGMKYFPILFILAMVVHVFAKNFIGGLLSPFG